MAQTRRQPYIVLKSTVFFRRKILIELIMIIYTKGTARVYAGRRGGGGSRSPLEKLLLLAEAE